MNPHTHHYYWDFVHDNDEVVGYVIESLDTVVGHFLYKDGYTEEKVEKLMADLNAGRVSAKQIKVK